MISFYTFSESWPFGRVHVIGDSHAPFCFTIEKSFQNFLKKQNSLQIKDIDHNESFLYDFFYKGKNFRVPFSIYWLGPRTMHRVGRDGLRGLNIKLQFPVSRKDIVVYVFGEIDVRCHIVYQAEIKKRNYEQILGKLVQDYVNTIRVNTFCSNTIPIVFNVIPPSCCHVDKKFEFSPYGSLTQRGIITKMINEALKRACDENNIDFLSTNEKFQDENGYLKLCYTDYPCHICPLYNDCIKNNLITLLLEKYLK